MATVIVLGSLVGLMLDIWWFRSLRARPPRTVAGKGLEVRPMLGRALPFFSVMFFGAIYFRIDVVILSFFKSDAVVGTYGAAYRLFETTNFLPEAFLFALFPVLCRLSTRNDNTIVLAAQKSFDLLMLAAMPIAVGTCLLSNEIVAMLYGPRFVGSVPVLRILAITVVPMYANGAFMQLLIATERQHKLV